MSYKAEDYSNLETASIPLEFAEFYGNIAVEMIGRSDSQWQKSAEPTEYINHYVLLAVRYARLALVKIDAEREYSIRQIVGMYDPFQSTEPCWIAPMFSENGLEASRMWQWSVSQLTHPHDAAQVMAMAGFVPFSGYPLTKQVANG